MLKVFDLYTIDKIFTEEAEIKLSPMAKMIYINCLTHHFKEMKPTASNCVGFDMFQNDIPEYEKFERLFQELHKAKLVAIQNASVRFENRWGRHIDRTRLDKVSPEEYVGGYSQQSPLVYKDELLKSERIIELMQMKHNISRKQVDVLMDLFIKEQEAFEKKYTGFTDCAKHFTFWIPNNLNKAQKENVKTGAKILGVK